MTRTKSILIAIVVGGLVGGVSSPGWSQELPGETRQSDPNRTRPGDDENVPGVNQLGTQELSRSDMRAIEQALRDEGYSPGTVDGVADDDTREAIRAFQQDSGFTESGMVDEQTADSLGVQIGMGSHRSERLSMQERW